MKRFQIRIVVLATLAMLWVIVFAAYAQRSKELSVYPPNARVQGLTYGEVC
jgi:hypothetical protein